MLLRFIGIPDGSLVSILWWVGLSAKTLVTEWWAWPRSAKDSRCSVRALVLGKVMGHQWRSPTIGMYTRWGSRDVDKRDYVSCKALVCGGKIKVTELAVGGLDAELPVRGYQGSHVSLPKGVLLVSAAQGNCGGPNGHQEELGIGSSTKRKSVSSFLI